VGLQVCMWGLGVGVLVWVWALELGVGAGVTILGGGSVTHFLALKYSPNTLRDVDARAAYLGSIVPLGGSTVHLCCKLSWV
jgi:hypothetical protein